VIGSIGIELAFVNNAGRLWISSLEKGI